MSIEQLNTENFMETIQNSNTPVLVDFYADWCGPCKAISRTLEEMAAESTDYRIYKVNVDNEPQLAMEYGVKSIPFIAAFKDGALLNKAVGVRPKEELLKLMQ